MEVGAEAGILRTKALQQQQQQRWGRERWRRRNVVIGIRFVLILHVAVGHSGNK